MYKRFSKHQNNEETNKSDLEHDHIVSELERSYSSLQSINNNGSAFSSAFSLPPESSSRSTATNGEKHDPHFVMNEQFQAIQLAQILEKTAFELRVYSKRRFQRFTPKTRRKKKLPPCVTNNLFLITLVWQVISIMVVFQFVNLVLSISATMKLKKQYIHKTASMKFMLQSYASTVVLFAGLYTFVAKINPHYFSGLEKVNRGDFRSVLLFAKLFFTSISTGTLCGAAKVTAVHFSTEFIMALQMLLSFIYFASILSQVLSPGDGKSKDVMYKMLLEQNEQMLSHVTAKKKSKSHSETI
ncbi:uncharacterized protein [Clytia hemisphaerica]|uniref:uncharacterized protein isoform X2 n=1 Tax=Clytia hemisphaerica TaxID=252671 RepID=UPI0034D5F3FE